MAAPYIPPKDAMLNDWLNNFSDLITAAPATYGLDAPAAADIAVAVGDWNTAYALVIVPATKTKVTVAAKNAAKVAAVTLCRTYASQIRINPGVLNSDKIALGLNLPNNSPSPIPPPATFPLLAIQSAGPLLHVIRYADNTTPDLRKKPAGAIQMELWRGVGTAVIADPALCSLLALVTKQPYQSVFNPADAGKMATYFARWSLRTGGYGPWSASINMTVATGS